MAGAPFPTTPVKCLREGRGSRSTKRWRPPNQRGCAFHTGTKPAAPRRRPSPAFPPAQPPALRPLSAPAPRTRAAGGGRRHRPPARDRRPRGRALLTRRGRSCDAGGSRGAVSGAGQRPPAAGRVLRGPARVRGRCRYLTQQLLFRRAGVQR